MAASVAVPRLLTDAVAVAAKSEVEDRAVAAFRSDAPLRMLVTRRTAHDRVMAVQSMLADLGYLARQNFIGNLGPATGSAIRAFQKANGLPVTGAFTDELASEVYRAAGKTEPPEGHLFVRQRFKRVFDLPISFRDPAVSLGTHVFTVVKRGDEAKPEWMAVSLEGGDAASVLDRIDIPDDVRRSIAPRLTPGSTLIVADKSEYSAILPEGDDFLVSTAEQAAAEDAKVEQASAGPDDGRAGQSEGRQEAGGACGTGGEDAKLRRAPPRDQAALYQQAVALRHALFLWAIGTPTDFKLTVIGSEGAARPPSGGSGPTAQGRSTSEGSGPCQRPGTLNEAEPGPRYMGSLFPRFKGSTRNSRCWTRRPFSDSAIVAGVAVVNMLSKSIPH